MGVKWLVDLWSESIGESEWISSYVLNEHEALGVGDDLGSVQGLLQVINESLLVTGELGDLGSLQDTASLDTLVLQAGQASREDSLANQGDGHTEVKSVDGGPLAGTLLASGVKDLLNDGDTVVIIEAEDVTSDLDKEGVKNTAVPLLEDITHLSVGHAETTLHNVVDLIQGQ